MFKTTATNLTEKRRNKRCSNNFQDVLCHVSDLVRGITSYTVTVSYCLLYMNQVQGDFYLYTRQIKLKKKTSTNLYYNANGMIAGESLMLTQYEE